MEKPELKCCDHVKEKDAKGYIEWHDLANTAARKGQVQLQCTECNLWFFPWEMR